VLKFTLLFFVTLFSLQSFAQVDCAIKAESYVVDAGITKPARYMGKTREGELIFNVRANLHGGDSEYEVVLDRECNYRSLRLVWAE
jgi:hypothetical protein